MTLSEFLLNNSITSVEISEDFGLIFNVYVGETCYGLDTEIPNVPYGTKLSLRDDFTLENNILSIAGISLDTTTTEMF